MVNTNIQIIWYTVISREKTTTHADLRVPGAWSAKATQDEGRLLSLPKCIRAVIGKRFFAFRTENVYLYISTFSYPLQGVTHSRNRFP